MAITLKISFALFLALVFTTDTQGQGLALNDAFGVGGLAIGGESDRNETTRELIQLPDGKILLLGDSYLNTSNDWYISMAQFNPDGSIDTRFGANGTVLKKHIYRARPFAAARQADGKIVVVGSDNVSNGVSQIKGTVFRFNEDGSTDTDFGNGGYINLALNGDLFNVNITNEGKIVTSGISYASRSAKTFRLFSDGSPDTTFSDDGAINFGEATSSYSGFDSMVLEDGSIITAASVVDGRNANINLTKLNPFGVPDSTFGFDGILNTGIILSSTVNVEISILETADKSILVASQVRPNQLTAVVVAKYDSNGAVDQSFGTSGKTILEQTQNLTTKVIRTNDQGEIFVGGGRASGFGKGFVAKLLSDGSLDTNFEDGGFLDADLNGNAGTHWLTEVVPQEDGGFLLAAYDFSSRKGDMVAAMYSPRSNVSIEIPFEESGLEIYPNPASEQLIIDMSQVGDFTQIELFDSLGRIVLMKELSPVARQSLDTTNFVAGSYFLRLSNSDRQVTKQFLIK